MPFIHTIEAKLRFECKMLEKAIIFFESKWALRLKLPSSLTIAYNPIFSPIVNEEQELIDVYLNDQQPLIERECILCTIYYKV